MSDTAAAIRAAREVQADTLSPELYRLAGEWFFKAKHEYKFKNFLIAKEFADRSRYYAEMAEYESIARGASRTDTSSIKDPLDDTGSLNTGKPQAEPYAYPTPAGTPADEYDQRKAADDKAAEDRATAAQAAAQPAAKTPAGGGAAAAPFYPNPSPSTPSTATPSAGRR